MRPKMIAGNWKMNKDLVESRALVEALKKELATLPAGVKVVVCPPFTSLQTVGELLRGTSLALGAQNMSEQDDGAYTGEVSWRMLRSVGCSYVILGHSERRQYFSESDALINRKARKALSSNLLPIICVGETLKEREEGVTAAIVTRQVRGVLEGITPEEMKNVTIAYEPVWAIGTGKNATPAEAQDVHLLIRGLLEGIYGREVASGVVIQYGGSVKPDNAAELLGQPDIDGALVGGACLKAESFSAIVRAAVR